MTQNCNSVAEVKTVASETPENKNVVETASTENMKEINPQANAPQVGTEAQPVNGNGVVDQKEENVSLRNEKGEVNKDELDRLNTACLSKLSASFKKSGILKNTYPVVSLKDLKTHGYQVGSVRGQRPVDPKSVSKLCKDLKDAGALSFSAYGILAPAEIVVALGYDVYDSAGKKVDPKDEAIKKMFVIIDGQHRLAACEVSQKYDMYFFIKDCPADIDADILNHNMDQHAWDSNSYRSRHSDINGKEDTLFTTTEKMKLILPGLSSKTSEYYASAKRDVVKLSDVKKGKMPDIDDNTLSIGVALVKAVSYQVRDEKKGRKLEVADAVFSVKNALSNSVSGEVFTKLFMIYSGTLAETEQEAIQKLIGDGKFDDYEAAIKKGVKALVKQYQTPEVLQEAYDKALATVDAYISGIKIPEEYKNTSLSEFIAQDKKIRAAKAETEAKEKELSEQIKALQKQLKTAKKANKAVKGFTEDND